MASPEFAGKYILAESKNFDEFMGALGVNYFLRKIGNKVTPELTIENKDDHYSLTSVSTFKTTKLEFDVGKEFETTTPDGRKVKSTVTLDDGKLIQKESTIGAEGDGKDCTYIRELDANKDLKVTCILGNIECIRLYKRM
ncbi:fatty acid-binding protein, heart-like [Lytechinus variegatus]|uniref:fatty acid-binding protein, heart-like n=1 Tax=Lytechinus variegatus TaxID=7654 RepID=UPI001BB21745|nr:fatty acid-binding protein, heart-like [Lytechinus variegatus]